MDPAVARERLAAVAAALPSNTFTNFKPFHGSGVGVIVFDALTGGGEGLFRQELIDYVKTAPGRTFVIFRLDTQLHLVLGPTADAAKVIAAIQSDTGVSARFGTSFVQKRKIIGDAVDQIANYLAPIPGRKTTLWFSAAIGHLLSSSNGADPDPEESSMFCRWTDSLQQRRIDVYRFDVDPGKGYSGLGCRAGRSVGNTIASIFDASAYYYTFSYTPTNENWDGKYRKFKVTANTRGSPWKGVVLDYRDGYYGRPDDGSVERSIASTALSDNESPVLERAMELSASEFDGVIFEATTTLSSQITKENADAAPSPGNYLSSQLRTQGYRDLMIRFDVRANQLGLIAAPDQTSFAEQLQVVAVVYDSMGREVNSKKSTVSVVFASPNDPRLNTTSISADLGTQVPAKGDYFLRVGVVDLATDKVGALETPVSSIKAVTEIAPGKPGK